MALAYAFKHVFRSWKLFLALIISITLASAFFAGTDIKANVTAQQALDQQLSNTPLDMTATVHSLNSTQILSAKEKILDIEGVADVEIVSSAEGHIMLVDEIDSVKQYEMKTIGITNDSHIYDGWLNRPPEIGENETYILEGSVLAGEVEINHTIQVNFTVYIPREGWSSVRVNLTVKDLAQLDDKAYSIVHAIAYGHYHWLQPLSGNLEFERDTGFLVLLVDWEKTMWKVIETAYELNPSGGLVEAETSLLIYLDRPSLITPWDIDSSINNIKALEYTIENKIGIDVQNNLEWPLNFSRITSMRIRFMITLVSLPIFFMAWYMGTTVSNVSFNLRRREIGLLSTKGFSRGQILRIFLTETLLIGLIGGVLGVFLGFLLNPLFTQFSTDALFNPQMISPYTMIFTVAFGIIIAFLSTCSSARKASQLPTVDALREYLPMEEEKPYKKRWPWVAFILGTYKIIVFILGIDVASELSGVIWSGNFILILLVGIFLLIDTILNYIGPLLFFWGFTKLFIQSSLKFQELTTKATKFLGDLGVLATKNVRRNPARSAAIAFLIALIIGYSVQVTGQLASEQDYAIRQNYYQVGADVVVHITYADEAPDILDTIMANVSEHVQNATTEYSFSAFSHPASIDMTMKAVEPQSWLKTAYYEGGWFSGNDVTTALNNLAAEKNTIILERGVAKLLNLELGGYINLRFGSLTKRPEVVGFFGPEPSEQGGFPRYQSFISHEFYEDLRNHVSAYAKTLLKLKGGIDGKGVVENIRNLEGLNIGAVESFAEKWQEAQTDVIAMGMLDVQRLGIIFAILAACVGTALVSSVSMKERSREATIMSVKGLSYKQLVIMFLTENLALVTFSSVLGVVVGLIVVYGNISSINAFASFSLVQHRLALQSDSTLMLVSCIALIFISTILPILIMSRKYVTKLERMVRLR